MEAGVGLLAIGILLLFCRSLAPPPAGTMSRTARWLTPVGMALLVLGVGLGVAMTVQGHQAIANGHQPGVHTSGALVVHGMPLHAPQLPGRCSGHLVGLAPGCSPAPLGICGQTCSPPAGRTRPRPLRQRNALAADFRRCQPGGGTARMIGLGRLWHLEELSQVRMINLPAGHCHPHR